jgi:hypothetical protein
MHNESRFASVPWRAGRSATTTTSFSAWPTLWMHGSPARTARRSRMDRRPRGRLASREPCSTPLRAQGMSTLLQVERRGHSAACEAAACAHSAHLGREFAATQKPVLSPTQHASHDSLSPHAQTETHRHTCTRSQVLKVSGPGERRSFCMWECSSLSVAYCQMCWMTVNELEF